MGTRILLFTSQCTVAGQLIIDVQKVSACPPGLASLCPTDAWQKYRYSPADCIQYSALCKINSDKIMINKLPKSAVAQI